MCDRKLWDDATGLTCSRTDAHAPGPSTCSYVGSEPADRHAVAEQTQDGHR